MKIIRTFKEYLKLSEKVSPDCSTGAGEIPEGPWKGFKVVRTAHLDEPRPPKGNERDEGFNCDTFDKLMSTLLKKRPLGLQDGEYLIFWENKKGYQTAAIIVDNADKKVIFKTVIQGDKRKVQDYRLNKSGKRIIDLGKVPEPKV